MTKIRASRVVWFGAVVPVAVICGCSAMENVSAGVDRGLHRTGRGMSDGLRGREVHSRETEEASGSAASTVYVGDEELRMVVSTAEGDARSVSRALAELVSEGFRSCDGLVEHIRHTGSVRLRVQVQGGESEVSVVGEDTPESCLREQVDDRKVELEDVVATIELTPSS